MAKTQLRVADPGFVHVQRRSGDDIVITPIPVVSRDSDVSEADDCWRITEANGDKHWYPKDSLLGVVVRGPHAEEHVEDDIA